MSSTVILSSNVENITPNDNVVSTPTAIKPIATPLESTPISENITPPAVVVPEAEHTESDANEDQEIDDEEGESEDPSFAEDSEDEIEEDDDETADQYGEQSEEVTNMMSMEEEARAAIQLAQAYGLNSTDDALNLVGKSKELRMGTVISNYSMHLEKEPEVKPFYDEISEQITNLRAALDVGIGQLVALVNFTINVGGVEMIRTQMELFMRELLRQSAVISEYRGGEQVRVADVLQALSMMNRPMYWDSKEEGEGSSGLPLTTTSTEGANNGGAVEEDDDAMEEDAMEEDEEDEEEDMGWEKENALNEEEEAREYHFGRDCFREAVNVLSSFSLSAESFEVIQAATENYLLPLVEASAKSTKFVGKNEIGGDEVRFALQMINKQ